MSHMIESCIFIVKIFPMRLRSFLFSTILLLGSVVFLYSCKKDSSAVSNTWWQVDQKRFESNKNAGVVLETDTATIIGAASENKDAIVIIFNKKPVSGRYYVVDTRIKANAATYDDNECAILITDRQGLKSYWSFFHHEGVVDVSYSGKKMQASLSSVKLGLVDESLNITEVFASGSIIEK